jgi:hypothetical protein
VVTSSETGNGKPWVALVGDGLELRGKPRVLSVAAETEVAGRRVLVYGSVPYGRGDQRHLKSPTDAAR